MPNRPSCSALSSPLKWRKAVAHQTLAAQLTSLLLHHKNAISLLRSKTSLLPRPFTSSLLRRILTLTQLKPEASLRFFLFASSQLSLSPGLLELSTIASILVAGGHHSPAAGLFAPALVSHALPNVLDSLLRASSSCNISQSKVLSFALELYCKSSSANAMETFRRMRVLKLAPSSRSINALLNFLYLSGEVHRSWMVCAAALRLGSEMNDGIWAVLVCLLLHDGKLQRAETLMSSGFGLQLSNYDLVVGCYASRGEFGSALRVLNGMEKKGFRPGLSTWSSILEESCRFGNLKMVGLVLKEMIVMDLLPVTSSLDIWLSSKIFFDIKDELGLFMQLPSRFSF